MRDKMLLWRSIPWHDRQTSPLPARRNATKKISLDVNFMYQQHVRGRECLFWSLFECFANSKVKSGCIVCGEIFYTLVAGINQNVIMLKASDVRDIVGECFCTSSAGVAACTVQADSLTSDANAEGISLYQIANKLISVVADVVAPRLRESLLPRFLPSSSSITQQINKSFTWLIFIEIKYFLSSIVNILSADHKSRLSLCFVSQSLKQNFLHVTRVTSTRKWQRAKRVKSFC